MKLLLAVSADGYLCRDEADDMKWTGPLDKFVFKVLTMSSAQPVFAGSVTYDMMPNLRARTMFRLSQRVGGLTLKDANFYYPYGWLIGGPTVAELALKERYVERAFICRVPVTLGSGISAAPLFHHLPEVPTLTMKLDNYEVDVFTGLFSHGS